MLHGKNCTEGMHGLDDRGKLGGTELQWVDWVLLYIEFQNSPSTTVSGEEIKELYVTQGDVIPIISVQANEWHMCDEQFL